MTTNCYQCGEPGHMIASCPALLPGNDDEALTYAAHLAVIDAIVANWHEGKLSIDQKRKMISDENRAYYGPSCRRALAWP
jgi:Zinc knuckle